MTVRPRSLVAVGLLTYLVALLVTLPATQLRGTLGTALPELRLGELSGPARAGSSVPLAIHGVRLDAGRWEWHPLQLLLGRLATDIELQAGPSELRGGVYRQVGFGTTVLSRVTGHVDLAWLSAGIPGLPGRARGRLTLDDVGATLTGDGWPTQAGGHFELRGLEVTAPVKLLLGGFSGTLADEGGQLRIEFTTTPDNGIDGSGRLLLSADGGYRLSAQLAARDGSDAAATGLLRLAGRPGPDGRVNVDRNGRWR